MQGLWIHEVFSIPVHVYPLDTIGNETRQTKKFVSSLQQTNVGADVLTRGVKLCVVHSVRAHEWAFASEFLYRLCFVEWFTR